jgi:intracellular sulfur oxidation DsrE/DsrF family protein
VFPEYEPQKVIYHVTSGAGWLGSEHRQRLRVLSNHIAALPKGAADLRVVLQGEGVDLLIAARKTESLAAEIDRLKTAGVRFLVCANTIGARKIDIANLHGADRADFVKAGVAESARLQAAGYVYLKI